VRQRLAASGHVVDTAQEADQIFRFKLGLTPEQRIMHAHGEVGPLAEEEVQLAVAERERGRPLAYATGFADFFGLTYAITSDVLVPRPETEFLVQRGIDYLSDLKESRPRLLDLGSGSGCVGLTLAVRFPRLHVTLTDVSEAALEVTRSNARRFGVEERCLFLAGDWFNALKRRERYNAILCNPPYITSRMDPELAASVREHEPSLALFLDENPEEFFFRLARQAVSHLVGGGLFAVEVGYDTAWHARTALGKVKQLSRGQGVHDFSGLERVIWGYRR
jgi:release factor glutamine methyltransferase